MNEIDDATLEQALADACSNAAGTEFQDVASVASALRSRATDTDDDSMRALVAALEYQLIVDEERSAPSGAFGPIIEVDDQRYPPPLNQVDELVPGTYDVWLRAIPLTHVGLVRARFADLLWEARFGDQAHEFARTAIESYASAASEGFGHPVEVSQGLQRAIELASEINDQARRSAAIDAAVSLADSAVESDDWMPGVVLPLLAVFVEDRPDQRPPGLHQLLARALERFREDPWILESILELQAQLAAPEDRAVLRSQIVEASREEARRSEGLVKYGHLQHAIELAERNGLTDLADNIRRDVEAMSSDELDLKRMSPEVTIPREQVEELIAWYVGDDNIEAALTRFGSHLPSGDTEDNKAFVEKLMVDHPVQFLFTTMQIGPQNSLARSIGADEQAEIALVQHEAQRASMFSIFAVEILDAIRERYGPVSAADHWFEGGVVEPTVSAAIVRAVEHYEEGQFDSAAFVLAPRLERVVRRIAMATGLTVTSSPDQHGRAGGVRGLGRLLSLLTGSLPEPTRRYLKVLLTDVSGLNLRNRIGHALDDEVSHREAVLLIQCACHLRLLAPAERSDIERLCP